MASDIPDGEYTRMQADIQLGDGIDRRGEVTVEVVRSVNTSSDSRRTRSVMLPDGNTISAHTTDEVFAEFYFEACRATEILRERLGLPDDEDSEGDEE